MCSDIPKVLLHVIGTHVCVLIFLRFYLSVVAGSIPIRCCIYCQAVISGGKLNRHIFGQHKCETDVKAAMLKTRHAFFQHSGSYQNKLLLKQS